MTAKGRPSGTATTIIVIPRMKAFKIPFSVFIVQIFMGGSLVVSFIKPLMTSAKNVRSATPTPNIPI